MNDPTKVLDEIERLLRMATPGPWTWWPGYGISPRKGVSLSFDAGSDDGPSANAALAMSLRNNADALVAIARAAANVDRLIGELADWDTVNRALGQMHHAVAKLGEAQP